MTGNNLLDVFLIVLVMICSIRWFCLEMDKGDGCPLVIFPLLGLVATTLVPIFYTLCFFGSSFYSWLVAYELKNGFMLAVTLSAIAVGLLAGWGIAFRTRLPKQK